MIFLHGQPRTDLYRSMRFPFCIKPMHKIPSNGEMTDEFAFHLFVFVRYTHTHTQFGAILVQRETDPHDENARTQTGKLRHNSFHTTKTSRGNPCCCIYQRIATNGVPFGTAMVGLTVFRSICLVTSRTVWVTVFPLKIWNLAGDAKFGEGTAL